MVRENACDGNDCGFTTTNRKLAGITSQLLVTTAVSVLEFTNVVGNGLNRSANSNAAPLTKPDPAIVTVVSFDPGAIDGGDTEFTTGGGLNTERFTATAVSGSM